jgi:hypothetical protein
MEDPTEPSECVLVKYINANAMDEVRQANQFYRAVWSLSSHAENRLVSVQNEVIPVSESVFFFECLARLVQMKDMTVKVDELSVTGTVNVGNSIYRLNFDWRNAFKVLSVEDERGSACTSIMQACLQLPYPRDMHLAMKLLGEEGRKRLV